MEKINQLSICFLMICVLAACGGSNSGGNSGDNSGGNKVSYMDACKALDFETAHDTLNVYRDAYAESRSKGNWYKEERKSAQEKYYNAFDYIYKAEVQYLLSELNDDECKDRIIFLLEKIPIEGEKVPEGLCDYYVACRGSFGEDGIPLDAYIVWTQHYNRLCSNILTLAINRKNQELAKTVLLQFVDNVEAIKGENEGKNVNGVKVDGNHGYIKYTSADRDAAQKIYQEAVRSGAFNK